LKPFREERGKKKRTRKEKKGKEKRK